MHISSLDLGEEKAWDELLRCSSQLLDVSSKVNVNTVFLCVQNIKGCTVLTDLLSSGEWLFFSGFCNWALVILIFRWHGVAEILDSVV